MANQEHLDILKQGVEIWNQWRNEHPRIRLNFCGVDLTQTNLSNANLSHIKLNGVNLRAYPNNPAARKAIKPQAKWRNAR
jgi:uncharacterized protein YjbI with pentapeptide repeats